MGTALTMIAPRTITAGKRRLRSRTASTATHPAIMITNGKEVGWAQTAAAPHMPMASAFVNLLLALALFSRTLRAEANVNSEKIKESMYPPRAFIAHSTDVGAQSIRATP